MSDTEKAKRSLEGKLIKEEVDKFFELEDKITETAEELLRWYKKNVDSLKGEDPEFEGFENNLIWYGNGSLRACVTLPIEMLYKEEAKKEYLDELERKKKERQQKIKDEEKKKKKEKEEAKYKRYLELKEEFES